MMAMTIMAIIMTALFEPVTAITRRGQIPKSKRVLTYIFADEDDDLGGSRTEMLSPQPARGRVQNLQHGVPATSKQYISGVSLKLQEIAGAFKQAVTFNNQKEKDVHVGKFLTAMKKMELHMRAVGMTQSANEIKNNHEKVMRLYSAAPVDKRDSISTLLKWEVEVGVHGSCDGTNSKSPIRVKNNSGAMGMFWLGHSVKYQSDLYRLMIEEDMEPVQAATMAFHRDLEPHLDWASKKLCKAAIPRMTPSSQEEFFSILGGFDQGSCGPREHAGIKEDVKSMLGVWDELFDGWTSKFEELNLRDI
jgi:hypothetical protein